MKQYQIGTPEFVSTKDNTIKVEIKFRRDTMSELLTTILPTVLIVIVCSSSSSFNFIYSDLFRSSINVSNDFS